MKPAKKKNLLVKNKSNPLDKIELPSEKIVDVLVSATIGSIASSIPGINKIVELAERADQASREEKLNFLLTQYSTHFDSLDDTVAKLKLFTATRGGQTVFRKVIQIIDKGPEDQEWLNLLARVLKKITDQDLGKYFGGAMYYLAQIDRLTPQALILISKYDTWRTVNIQGTTTTSGKTQGDWAPQVTRFFTSQTGIAKLETGGMINHSFRELESSGMLTLEGHQLKLTAIALEINRLLKEES